MRKALFSAQKGLSLSLINEGKTSRVLSREAISLEEQNSGCPEKLEEITSSATKKETLFMDTSILMEQ